MSDLPTLIVDKYQDVFMMGDARHTVRVDGPLPTVPRDAPHNAIPADKQRRLLRVGDRVTLATEYVKHHKHGRTERIVPFATATVAEVAAASITPHGVWLVTVTDVEALA